MPPWNNLFSDYGTHVYFCVTIGRLIPPHVSICPCFFTVPVLSLSDIPLPIQGPAWAVLVRLRFTAATHAVRSSSTATATVLAATKQTLTSDFFRPLPILNPRRACAAGLRYSVCA